jgi:N-methylhydantoinase A
MAVAIGVDTGGTFTDTVVLGPKGITIGKRSSTPPSFVEGVLDSLGDAGAALDLERTALLQDAQTVLHGTTIVVNAIVERTLADVGVITTRGFGDTALIARGLTPWTGLSADRAQRRAEVGRPEPLIPTRKRLVGEVVERIDFQGRVVVELDEEQVRSTIRGLVAEGAEALAVCLLWSFKNPKHELRIAEIAAEEAPDLTVTLSSEAVPKKGEYERMATTAFHSASGNVVTAYLDQLTDRLGEEGMEAPLYIMQGNGGVLPVQEAKRRPVNLIGSGPAGGVLAAKLFADNLGLKNVICTDVGGTSFDVGLIVDGQPLLATQAIVEQHTLHLPALDVVSIGAGGGSIARAEKVGTTTRLMVGPESAGGHPGPVAYGRGGTAPTVTDADLVLGLIDPEYFLGGSLRLDVQAARDAIGEQIAKPLGMSVEEAAIGIVEIADSHMSDLMRQITVERGHDPRDFTAFLYGGGGPLHGTAYASKLGLRSLVVPGAQLASVFSAFGIACADVHYTLERTSRMNEPFKAEAFEDIFTDLEAQAAVLLERAGIKDEDRALYRYVDMAYGMQTHQIAVPVPAGSLSDQDTAAVAASFEQIYARMYGEGTGLRGAGLEAVHFRVQAFGSLGRGRLQQAAGRSTRKQAEPSDSRSVIWPELKEAITTPIHHGADLDPGMTIEGPAVVELPTTTVAVRPGQTLLVDESNNYLITEI